MMDVNAAVEGFDVKINRQLTFAGVLKKEYDYIGKEWTSPTVIHRYLRDYHVKVLPYFKDHPINEYTLKNCEKIIDELGKKYGKPNKAHFRVLIKRVFDRAAEIGVIKFPLWGSSFDSKQSFSLVDKVQNGVKKLVKFFSVIQEVLIHDLLFLNPYQDGYSMGLLIMFLTGARNLEAAAVCFEDVVIKGGRPCLVIINSIEELSAKAKAGTKTKNGFRYFPISWKFYRFLMQRKEWLRQKIENGEIVFVEGSEFQTLEHLPIACDGKNFTKYCTPSKLTDAGRELFKKIKITTEQMQILNEHMELDENDTIFGRFTDATAYAMRRNEAGHLCDCGCNIYRARYLFGHALDYGDIQRHHFINDDEICDMHDLLSNRALANEIEYDGVKLDFVEKTSPFKDVFRVYGVIKTEGRVGQTLVIKILPRESHVVTTASFGLEGEDMGIKVEGTLTQESHQVTDYTGGIIIPRHMVTLYDYWRPYALEEERRKHGESLLDMVKS